MKLFLVIVPDEIKVGPDSEDIAGIICKNLKRSIFFVDGIIGEESIFLFMDEEFYPSFLPKIKNILVDYFRVSERVFPVKAISLYEPPANKKPLTNFVVVRESMVDSVLRSISLEATETLQQHIISPLKNPKKITPGEIICFGSTGNVQQVFYLSEYEMLDVFIIDGQFKLDSVTAGRSVLNAYNRTKLAGSEFTKELKQDIKTGLKNLYAGLGKFIENIDK